jgi:hypothetical protein
MIYIMIFVLLHYFIILRFSLVLLYFLNEILLLDIRSLGFAS